MTTRRTRTNDGLSRRDMLKGAAAAGAAAWSAPVVLGSVASPAAAASGPCALYVYRVHAQANACGAYALMPTATCATPTSTTCASCSPCSAGTRTTVAAPANITFSGCSYVNQGTLTLGTATATGPGCTFVGFAAFTSCQGANAVALTPGSGSTTQNLGTLASVANNSDAYVYLLVST